jgi:hypothetical protein
MDRAEELKQMLQFRAVSTNFQAIAQIIWNGCSSLAAGAGPTGMKGRQKTAGGVFLIHHGEPSAAKPQPKEQAQTNKPIATKNTLRGLASGLTKKPPRIRMSPGRL